MQLVAQKFKDKKDSQNNNEGNHENQYVPFIHSPLVRQGHD
jgi:hypothetical protein